MLLCGASLNGVHYCNRLACPCGVLLWSGIGFRALCLCSIVSKRAFIALWIQILTENLCFQTLSQKNGEALHKFLELILEPTFSTVLL